MYDTTMFEWSENYKTYCLYVLEHTPRQSEMGFWYGRLGRCRYMRKILVQYTTGTERDSYDIIWKEVSTGDRIWSHRTNYVYVYQYPFLKQIKKIKKIYSLSQLAFFLLSTKEISIVKDFLLALNYFH